MAYTLYKRADSGATFSVIFGAIALVVIFTFAIWGFGVPHWKRTHPAPPSRTKWNDGSILTARRKGPLRRPFSFRSRTKPLFSRSPTAHNLPTYDPRVESPFPSDSRAKFYEGRDVCVSRTNSAPVACEKSTSDGLFTPIRRTTVEDEEYKGRHHTVPRGIDAKHFAGKSTDFGDAKEFILAVPEPLVPRPRDAGSSPAVTRRNENNISTATSSPAPSDKLPHPNKLFRAMQYGEMRSSLCSSTSLCVDHRKSDMAAAVVAKEMSDAVDQAIQDEEARCRHYRGDSSTTDSKASSQVATEACDTNEPNITALDRLRSYRSLTGSRPPKPQRAVTITRSQTPVEVSREMYGAEEEEGEVRIVSLPHVISSSTALNSNETSSEHETVSTPATSPTFAPSTLQLLPCPLRHARSEDQVNKTLPIAKSTGKDDGWGSAEVAFGCNVLSSQPLNEKILEVSRGFHHTGGRRKAAPPGLVGSQTYSPPIFQPTRKSSAEGMVAIPGDSMSRSDLKSRLRASSMYSRDTHGFGAIETPVTTEHSSPVIDSFLHHDVAGNPFKGRESVRDRIHEWTQLIDGLSTPPLPEKGAKQILRAASVGSLVAKKAQVDTEPTQAQFTNSVSSTNQCQGFDSINSRVCLGIAPGGAQWI